MRLCRDDALMKLLNQLGYQPVEMPRTGFEPPEVYSFSENRMIRLGPLTDYLQDGVATPQLRHSELPDIGQAVTSGKSAAAAGSFLEAALRCIGVTGSPKIDLRFTHGRMMTFSFTGVTSVSLDPSKVDQLLAQVRPDALAKRNADDDLLIAYEYAFAEALVMRDAAGNAGSLDVRALDIQNLFQLGGTAAVGVHDDASLSFSPKAGGPVIFAAKVGRLERRKKVWRFFPEELTGQGLTPDEAGGVPFLVQRGAILGVDDAN